MITKHQKNYNDIKAATDGVTKGEDLIKNKCRECDCNMMEVGHKLFSACVHCKTVIYCSKECQTAAWCSGHKQAPCSTLKEKFQLYKED